MFSRIITFIQTQLQRFPWLLFLGFLLTLLFKQMVWHMQFFADKVMPVGDMLSVALFLSLWLPLCRRRPWWTLLFLLAVNIWLYANVVYCHVWGNLLTMDAVRLAGNLRGFESSIFSGWNNNMLLWLAVPDVFFCLLLLLMPYPKKRSWRGLGWLLALYLLSMPVIQYCGVYQKIITERRAYNNRDGIGRIWYNISPLFLPYSETETAAWKAFLYQVPQEWERPYVYSHGILRYGVAICLYDAHYRGYVRNMMSQMQSFSSDDEQLLSSLCSPSSAFVPERNLVYVLVESLEGWPVNYQTQDGPVMPHLSRFMSEHTCFYAPVVSCQLRYGGSSDGQLINMTGLLPVSQGVTVTMYADRTYPNFAHYYPSSLTLNPSPGTWNQPVINPKYGIRNLCEEALPDDRDIVDKVQSFSLMEPYFLLFLTISSHVPFAKANEVEWSPSPDMPADVVSYLKCIHYADEQLGRYLESLTPEQLSRTDIVITGDHSILYSSSWDALTAFEQAQGRTFNGQPNSVPLIIFSPAIEQSQTYDSQAFQMDIFPTVQHIIGCSDPEWKGLGLDLLSNQERRLSPSDAEALSNRLIISDYFSQKPE